MSNITAELLAGELESFYPLNTLEEISSLLGLKDPGLLFPALLASSLAKHLLKKRPRSTLAKGIAPGPRLTAILCLAWRECGEEELQQFANPVPGLALFFREDGERCRIPPLTADLLLESFQRESGSLITARTITGEDGELCSFCNQLPDMLETLATGGIPELLLPGEPADAVSRQKDAMGLLSRLLGQGEMQEPAAAAAGLRSFLKGETEISWSEPMLPHLNFRPSRREQKRPDARVARSLTELMKELPTGQWIAVSDYQAVSLLQPEIRQFLDLDYAADYAWFEAEGHYRNYLGDSGIRSEQRYLDSAAVYQDACLKPLVSGFLGICLLAGIIDTWFQSSRDRFTPWQGIRYFRINDWGAFLLGSSREPPCWVPPRAIRLSAAGDIAVKTRTSAQADRLLHRIGEEIGSSAFQISREKILSSCSTRSELAALVREIEEQAELPLPPYWQGYLADLSSRGVELKVVSDTLVLRLPDHPELLRLLQELPEAGDLLQRAEGRCIIVRRENLDRLRRLAAQHGFLLDTVSEDPPL